MRAIFVNLLKSFWLSKGKFLLCVTAAVLSAWGISTMLYSYLMTERDFVVNFTESVPSDLILTVQNPTSTLIDKIQSHPDVRDMERRETIAGRIKNRNGNWMPIVVFAGENLGETRINKFSITDKKTEDKAALFVEKSGMGFLDAAWDSITVQFPGSVPQTYLFGGSVHDPGQAPSQMEQALYGYTTIANLENQLRPTQKRYLIKVKTAGLNTLELTLVGQQLAEMARAEGTVATFVVPPPGEHPHQGIVDGISFLQMSFGSILALLGIILLSLILITWLYPQITNVGIMKAIGASTAMIFVGYLLVLGLIVLLGLMAGMPLGYITAKRYSGAVAFIQNFTPVDRPLETLNHFIVFFPAALLPILFAFIPLLRASRTSVHSALNHVFYTPYKAVFNWTQAILTDSRLKYSANNLFRSNQRTLLLATLITVGLGLFTTGSNLKRSLQKDFAAYAEESGYGITIVLKDSAKQELPFLKELPFVEDVSYINTRGVRYTLPHQSHQETTNIRTYAPDYNFKAERIVKGTLDRNCTDCVYISQRYQSDFESIPLGAEIELQYQDNKIEKVVYSGVVKDISHPGFFRFGDQGNSSFYEIAIQLKPGTSSSDATRLLDDALLENDIDVRQVSDVQTRLLALENHLAPMYLVIQVMGIITVGIALAGLLIVLNLSMQERSREMGIMKAVGGHVSSIVNMYHREYFAVTGGSILAGLVIGYALNASICSLFGIMVINSPVPPLIDFWSASLASGCLLIVQTLLISLYVRYKLKRSSSRLLAEVF
jgi:putative ABC transport system permease protein